MLSPDTKIVDAHHHIWNPVSAEPEVGYVWLRKIGAPKPFGDPTPIQRDYLLDEFCGEHPKLTASVHVQVDGAIADPVAETEFVYEQAQSAGHDIAIVGFVDLSRDDCGDVMDRHMACPAFRGVRHILSRLDDQPALSFAPEHYLENPFWRQGFKELRKRGLSFDLQCYPEQMHDAALLFSQQDEVAVIIDHAGSPWDQSADGLARWRTGLKRLADLPQISIKLSGFGMFDRDRTKTPELCQTILELFGADRVMVGSNFPVDSLMASYGDYVDAIAAALPADTHEGVFGANARHVYRF
ncbi:MAG: amidohydrolase family protein [Pseudomonadota bacterium]